jgi:cysteine desulfurase family protein
MRGIETVCGTVVYLDNAATSFPKPPEVAAAIGHWLGRVGGSPGRSGHRLSTESARMVFETREAVASLLGVASSRQVVFTKNATEALNLALSGFLRRGDRVVTTSVEHNSVMRPLRALAAGGAIELSVVPCGPDSRLEVGKVAAALTPGTRLLVATHASNVTGVLMPLTELGALCRERGVRFLVDAAQTAGAVPLDMAGQGIDLLAFTGHKSLLGPPGTGGLCVAEDLLLEPLLRGGTGSNSEQEAQPETMPDRLEAGTQNTAGLAGLKAGVEFILRTGVGVIREREEAVTGRLLDGVRRIPGVTLHGPGEPELMAPVISLNLAGLAPSEAGFLLDEGYGILCRVGLQCAPSAHRTIGTFPGGTVRLSPGFFTTEEDVEAALAAIRALASRRG